MKAVTLRARMSCWARALVLAGLVIAGCGGDGNDPADDDGGRDGGADLGAACSTEPLRASNVHHVCDCADGADPGCVAGDDARDGLTPATARRSWAAAMADFDTMPAGHTVALCRGGRWRGVATQGTIRNPSCRADATCDLRDYGEASQPRPVLVGTGEPLFEIGRYQDYAQPPVQGLRFLNLDIRGVDTLWTILGSATDVEICGNAGTDATGGAQYVVTNSTTKRIAMHHNTFTRVGTGGQGYLGACDDCSIDANVWDTCGGDTNRDHPIYIGSNPEPCTSGCVEPVTGGSGTYHRTQRMRITNNVLTHSSPSGGVCVGTVIVVHEPHDDLLIENNLIHEEPGDNGGCFGISISSGGDEPGQWRRATIRRNQLYNAGYQPISIENCQDCVIDSNLVVSSLETFGIIVPWHPQSEGVGPNLVNTRTKVRNNTIVITAAATRPGGVGIGVGTEGTGHEVTNNAIYFAPGQAPNSWRCFDLDLGDDAYASRVGNACHGNVADQGTFRSYLSGDPAFTAVTADPATADLRPGAGSPLVDSGDAIHAAPTAIGSAPWSAADDGRTRDARPDIGAFER